MFVSTWSCNPPFIHDSPSRFSALQRSASGARRTPSIVSSAYLQCITASNAALPSHKLEGLVGPLRPWSGSLSCGAPPRPRPHSLLPFARASRVDARTKTGVCERAVRANWCAHTHVLGFVRRPPCGERQGDKELNRHAGALRGVKRDRTGCPAPVRASRCAGAHPNGPWPQAGRHLSACMHLAVSPLHSGVWRSMCPEGARKV